MPFLTPMFHSIPSGPCRHWRRLTCMWESVRTILLSSTGSCFMCDTIFWISIDFHFWMRPAETIRDSLVAKIKKISVILSIVVRVIGRVWRLLLLLLLLFKEVSSTRLGESCLHPISVNTQAPQYQPIDRKKRTEDRMHWNQSSRSLPPASSPIHFAVYGTHWKMCITGTQTCPISKLGGLKITTAFHKSSKTNWHQTHKHLRQYWYYGNRSVIGNRGRRWTFRNLGDINLSPESRETTQMNKPPKHYTRRGVITSVLLRKRANIPNGLVSP